MFECGGYRCTVSLVKTLEPLGNSAEYEREDNAGVASCAAQQTRSHAACNSRDALAVVLDPDFARGIGYGHGHICAGITVRHRKDVERVYLLAVRSD